MVDSEKHHLIPRVNSIDGISHPGKKVVRVRQAISGDEWGRSWRCVSACKRCVIQPGAGIRAGVSPSPFTLSLNVQHVWCLALIPQTQPVQTLIDQAIYTLTPSPKPTKEQRPLFSVGITY